MYSATNIREGSPPRLYRSTEEIRRDMMKISTQISFLPWKVSADVYAHFFHRENIFFSLYHREKVPANGRFSCCVFL